jgi:hypothetical protein
MYHIFLAHARLEALSVLFDDFGVLWDGVLII